MTPPNDDNLKQDDTLKQLYTDLQRQYDLTLDRRKNLTGQATNLISFTSIINTILIGIIVASATNKDVQTSLLNSSYYSLIVVAVVVGFSAYILTTIFSLLAFREPRWFRVPKMPDRYPIDSIIYFFRNRGTYNLEKIAIQLSEATRRHQLTNDSKYMFLRLAVIFLMIGIFATVIGGAAMIFTNYRTSHLMVVTHIIDRTSSNFLYNATDFTMHANGNNPSITDFPGSELGVNVTLSSGSYAITESKPESSHYLAGYSSSCIGTINNDETKKCTVTNIQR